MTTTSTLAVIYECTDCGERSIDRRCPDCNLFSRRLGTGGNCPNCDEPVLVEELFNPTHQAPSHTENLTGPAEVSLAVIGQVLRHDDPVTTANYARVDVVRLRSLAQPWPTHTHSPAGGERP